MMADWDWLEKIVQEGLQRLLALLIVGVLLLAALTMAGCAAWSHPTKSAADFYRDEYECDRDSAATQDPMRALLMKIRCLELKGWRQ